MMPSCFGTSLGAGSNNAMESPRKAEGMQLSLVCCLELREVDLEAVSVHRGHTKVQFFLAKGSC